MYNYNDLLGYKNLSLNQDEYTAELLSYDVVKGFVDFCSARNYGSSLLLGNGFSIACNQNFDLSNLTQQMASNNPIVNDIFAYLKRGNYANY